MAKLFKLHDCQWISKIYLKQSHWGFPHFTVPSLFLYSFSFLSVVKFTLYFQSDGWTVPCFCIARHNSNVRWYNEFTLRHYKITGNISNELHLSLRSKKFTHTMQGEKILNSCCNTENKKKKKGNSIGLELLLLEVKKINYIFYRAYSLNVDSQRNSQFNSKTC